MPPLPRNRSIRYPASIVPAASCDMAAGYGGWCRPTPGHVGRAPARWDLAHMTSRRLALLATIAAALVAPAAASADDAEFLQLLKQAKPNMPLTPDTQVHGDLPVQPQ